MGWAGEAYQRKGMSHGYCVCQDEKVLDGQKVYTDKKKKRKYNAIGSNSKCVLPVKVKTMILRK